MPTNSERHLDGIGSESDDIRYLFSYNLQRLAGISSRIASLELKDRFGLSVIEWRALAVLDFLNGATLNLLAQRAGVQKSQMSRLVADLEQSGYIEREMHPTDKRSTILQLSAKGKKLVRAVLDHSRERNRKMLSTLSAEERRVLMTLVGKVTHQASSYLEDIKLQEDQLVPQDPAPASLFEEVAG